MCTHHDIILRSLDLLCRRYSGSTLVLGSREPLTWEITETVLTESSHRQTWEKPSKNLKYTWARGIIVNLTHTEFAAGLHFGAIESRFSIRLFMDVWKYSQSGV